jgi:hypothetical protein
MNLVNVAQQLLASLHSFGSHAAAGASREATSGQPSFHAFKNYQTRVNRGQLRMLQPMQGLANFRQHSVTTCSTKYQSTRLVWLWRWLQSCPASCVCWVAGPLEVCARG